MTDPTAPPRPPIETLEDLQKHLQEACYVEMSTVPLYLYAMYSIQSQIEGGPAGYVGDINKSSSASAIPTMSAFRTIRSIVVEEMLHLTLARNVLYSIGGTINFYDEAFVPKFGVWDGEQQMMFHRLPLLPFNLERCTTELVKDTFMALESPAPVGAPPQSDWYNSIGQFYEAIEVGFDNVAASIGEEQLFSQDHARFQIHSVASYWNQEGGGAPLPVTSVASAKAAMNEIIVQGEGANGGDLAPVTFPANSEYVRSYEFSHYERFERIVDGIDAIGAVWPVASNPRIDQFAPNPDLQRLAEFCNAVYCYTLLLIDANYTVPLPALVVQHAVDGVAVTEEQWDEIQQDPAMRKKWGLTQALLTMMQGILFPVIDLIVREPMPGQPGCNAGPTFEFFDYDGKDPKTHLLALCDALVPIYPALSGEDSVRTRVADLPAVPLP